MIASRSIAATRTNPLQPGSTPRFKGLAKSMRSSIGSCLGKLANPEKHPLKENGTVKTLDCPQPAPCTSLGRSFTSLIVALFLFCAPTAAMAQPIGEPVATWGPGQCGGSIGGFSPTFFGNWWHTNFPPTGCLDTEIPGNDTQQHSYGRGADLQDLGATRRLVVSGWMEYNPGSSAGPFAQFALSAYTPAGDLDNTFGAGDGKVLTAFAVPARGIDNFVRSDNSIVTGGGDGNTMFLTAHQVDGALSWQVVTPVVATTGAVALATKDRDPTADFIAVGSDTTSGLSEIVVARFDHLGNVLLSQKFGNLEFGTVGLEFNAQDVAYGDDGYIYIAGTVKNPATLATEMILVKVDDAFTPDSSFGGTSALVPTAGVVTVQVFVGGVARSSEGNGVALSENGNAYIAGLAHNGVLTRMAIAAVNTTDGGLAGTSSIGPLLRSSVAHEILIDSRRRVVTVGEVGATAPQTPKFMMARFLPDGTPDPTFGASSAGVGYHIAAATAGPSRGFDVVRAPYTGDLGLAGDSVVDPGSISPFVTNWQQTAAKWKGGPVCGNGILEPTEDCEAPFGACCTSTCDFKPSTEVCRGSAGACDIQETCTGTSDTCPSDAVESAATICRASGGICDIEETCDGTSVTCPADAVESAATVCRGSGGICDIEETCDGTGVTCPADAVESAATVCRASGGICDIEETCDGTSVTCPADAVESAATVCRASGGICDIEETCDGASASCPGDAFESAATVCRASGGICDLAETCDGASANCPTDAFESAATVCRASGGVCDIEETCDGTSAGCPIDAVEPSTTVCRASVDLCDAEETCDGSGITCPSDGVEAAGTVCRPGVDECDADEECDGTASSCPADAFEPAGTPAPTLCDDGEACTADVCDGAGGCDNSGAVSSAGFDHNEDGSVDASDDVDTDSDGIIDACDNCISDCNPDQLDTDVDCLATGPWTASGAPECGDVCDVCPASDEVAMALDPNCATFDYNSSDDCCEETGAGVSVDATGESCGGPAGDTTFTSTGSNSSASMKIPAGAVSEDTSFSADSKTKGGDEFFVRGGSGTYVAGYDFGPEGVTFGSPVVVCMNWNDPDNDGFLEKSEGYDYKIWESKIAPYHIDSSGGEYKLADKCSLVPCTSFDADGFPDDWGGYTRYDEASTTTVDESTLNACCGATENKYCFEVYHFSTYGVLDPNCGTENLDRSKLKLLKLDKEIGEQKIIFSTEFTVPVDETTGEPDPIIDPIQKGFQISLLESQEVTDPILWTGRVEGGAYDKATKTGWQSNKSNTKWTYKGRDRADGILKVIIKTLYRKDPGLVKVKVIAKNAAIAGIAGPVQAEISLDPSGFLDRCAATAFSSPPASEFCAPNGAGNALICR